MIRYFIFLLAFTSSLVQAQSTDIRIVSYNLLNFPNGRNDCGTSNVNPPNRTDTLRKIMGYLQPDIFVGCEIQNEASTDSILTRTLNVFGTSHYVRAPFFYNTSGANDLQNALFYNSDKLIFQAENIIATGVRDINQYILYVIDPNLGIHHDTCFIEVYMCHLKAGNTATDAQTRAEETAILRQYIDNRPLNRHHFVCGDLNTYSSNEAGYQNLITGGITPMKDPINAPGNWNSNSSFAYLHTQSPRTTGLFACGSTGGLDDRFDHILCTNNVLTGADSLKYIPSTYKAIGNDGQHYNSSLLSGPTNSMYPDSVVKSCYYMSDHLPVKMDVRYTFPTNFGLALTYNLGAISCANSTSSATVIPTLGTAPFTYNWGANGNFQTTATATNLSGGNYCVIVTDATGKIDEICFQVPVLPSMQGSAFPSGENAGCDGQAFVSVSGGVQPYTFVWNDPQAQQTQNAVNLCAGTYTCTVTDNNGCTLDIDATILAANVGLEEHFSVSEVRIYPNPFTDVLNIVNESLSDLSQLKCSLFTINGQLVKEFPLDNLVAKEILTIDLNELNKGSYFLVLSSGKVSKHFKLMK